MSFGMGLGIFGIMEVLFFLGFGLVFVIIAVTAIKGLGQWNRNNHSPKLVVSATVVSKRTNVTHHRHANAGDVTGAHGYHTTTDTSYYVTFQVKSGDRMELRVPGSRFGLMVEGDRGDLTFQGTRFVDFQRQY